MVTSFDENTEASRNMVKKASRISYKYLFDTVYNINLQYFEPLAYTGGAPILFLQKR